MEKDTVDVRVLACEAQRRWHWFQDRGKVGRHLKCFYCGLSWTFGNNPKFNGVQILGTIGKNCSVWIFRNGRLQNLPDTIRLTEGYDELPDGTR